MKKDNLDSLFFNFCHFLENKTKQIGAGIAITVLLIFVLFYSLRGKEEETSLNIAKTEKAFQNFQVTIEQGEKEHKNSLKLLEQALSATPFLYPKYDGKIVEFLLQENSPEDALPALKRIKTRALNKIPLYLSFTEGNVFLSLEKNASEKELQEKNKSLLQEQVTLIFSNPEELQKLSVLESYSNYLKKEVEPS